ncbi:hypothetical protein [Moorena sp. SIO3H5]|nr:hypothetical protein [Moorena sp. SIO3H5]
MRYTGFFPTPLLRIPDSRLPTPYSLLIPKIVTKVFKICYN